METKDKIIQTLIKAANTAAAIEKAEKIKPGHVEYMSKTGMANCAASIIDDIADVLAILRAT